MVERATSIERKLLETQLKAVARQDRTALYAIYKLTNAKLFGVCLRISKNEEVAQELLQETYIKVWNRASSYRSGGASPMSWLIAIARNTSIDWRRSQPSAVHVDESALLDLADESVDIPGGIDAEREASDLHSCLSQIDGKYASAIRTAYIEGLTYAELAAQIDKPVGTVKSWIRRGLQQLKGCINKRRRGIGT